jgi:tRNA-splicing ligase RtcB (3'-phosphate/5'-hydroxy nucleic acid ligase)
LDSSFLKDQGYFYSYFQVTFTYIPKRHLRKTLPMKKRDLEKLGIPRGPAMDEALAAVIAASRDGLHKREIVSILQSVVENPSALKIDPIFGSLARSLLDKNDAPRSRARSLTAPWKLWGADIDKEAIAQMERACALPVAVRGALMPDAHVGYGLPIGGVLAVRGAVIPYAVGVDIACRMKLTVLDLPVSHLESEKGRLKEALQGETRFGVGASYRMRLHHPVMDVDWNISPFVKSLKDLAWEQLGTSGSGNHFVEFGNLAVLKDGFDLEKGSYLALLSHSGSRGTGSKIADHYSGIARQRRRDLPNESRHLAWLDLDAQEGQEYWAAMELMGRYAAANHELIHRRIAARLGAAVLLDLENHHNFAWKERHDGEELIVHRKGATPAAQGVRAIIPGTMASPGFVVIGKGNADSLMSASHGAGRAMSRTEAKRSFSWSQARDLLDAAGVTVISAGLDEVPMVYKDIQKVMNAQRDLVEVIARFDPKIVKMAPAGERGED